MAKYLTCPLFPILWNEFIVHTLFSLSPFSYNKFLLPVGQVAELTVLRSRLQQLERDNSRLENDARQYSDGYTVSMPLRNWYKPRSGRLIAIQGSLIREDKGLAPGQKQREKVELERAKEQLQPLGKWQ